MTAQVSARTGALGTASAYARLVKYRFILDFLLCLVVAWTAVEVSARLSGDTLLTLLFFAIGEIGVLSAVMALDDVTGIEDGSDDANYLGADQTALRPVKRKPLLTGELTVSQARWFGYLSLAWGAAWWGVAIAFTPNPTLWAVLVTVALLVLSVQYSWGLKLSYYGLGEAVLLYSAAAFVLAPFGLITGELTTLILVEALLFGFGQVLIAGYSNTNDISGDAAVGRRTMAVLTSPAGNRVFLGALTTANLLVVIVPVVAGLLPWWWLVALSPFMGVRLLQYGGFLRNGDPLVARVRGITAFRTVVACMIAFNLLHFGLW